MHFHLPRTLTFSSQPNRPHWGGLTSPTIAFHVSQCSSHFRQSTFSGWYPFFQVVPTELIHGIRSWRNHSQTLRVSYCLLVIDFCSSRAGARVLAIRSN